MISIVIGFDHPSECHNSTGHETEVQTEPVHPGADRILQGTRFRFHVLELTTRYNDVRLVRRPVTMVQGLVDVTTVRTCLLQLLEDGGDHLDVLVAHVSHVVVDLVTREFEQPVRPDAG